MLYGLISSKPFFFQIVLLMFHTIFECSVDILTADVTMSVSKMSFSKMFGELVRKRERGGEDQGIHDRF